MILQGAGDRGLCAGGDIVAIYHDIRNCGGAKTRQFWFDEYRLNAFIAAYPKPYIALMDGLVMGGGVGVSAHGSVRIVTEKSKVGMPEVSIGFIPDVGGTDLLSRAPGLSGLHAGLTGAAFSGADAIALGFADHYVPHEKLPYFIAAVVAAAYRLRSPHMRSSRRLANSHARSGSQKVTTTTRSPTSSPLYDATGPTEPAMRRTSSPAGRRLP